MNAARMPLGQTYATFAEHHPANTHLVAYHAAPIEVFAGETITVDTGRETIGFTPATARAFAALLTAAAETVERAPRGENRPPDPPRDA